MKRILSLILTIAVLSTLIVLPTGVSAAAVNITANSYNNFVGGNLNQTYGASKHKEVFGIGGKDASDSSIALSNIGSQVDAAGNTVTNTSDRTKGLTLSDLGYPYLQFAPSDMEKRSDYLVMEFNILRDDSKPFDAISFTTNGGTGVGPALSSAHLIHNQWNKVTYVFKMNAGSKSNLKVYYNGKPYVEYDSKNKAYVSSWETILGTSGKTAVRIGPKFNKTVNYIWKDGAPDWDDKDESGNYILQTGNVKNYVSGPAFDEATGIAYMDDLKLYSSDTEPVIKDTAAYIAGGPVERNEYDNTKIYNKITVLEGSKLSDFNFANASDATIKLYKDATLAEEITDVNHILAAGNVITTKRATDYRSYTVEGVSNGLLQRFDGSNDMSSNSTITTQKYADPYAGNVYKQTYNITNGNSYLTDYTWMSVSGQVNDISKKEDAYEYSKKMFDKYVHISLNYMIPQNTAFTKMFVASLGHGVVGSKEDIKAANADGKWHHLDVIVNRSNSTSVTYTDGVKTGENSSSVLGKFGYNNTKMFSGIRLVVYGTNNTPIDMYIDDLIIRDELTSNPLAQKLEGVSVNNSSMKIIAGTTVADLKAANPTADIKVYNENGIVADDADAAVEGNKAFIKTANGASRTYDVAPWDGTTVISESKDIIASNLTNSRMKIETLTGGLGGADADNKYFKVTRTFTDVRENTNPDDDKLYTGMDSNMYFIGPDFKQVDPESKYYVIEANVWNNDKDTVTMKLGTNTNSPISHEVKCSDFAPNTWNKFVNVIDLTPNSEGKYAYTTYLNGAVVGTGFAGNSFISKNKVVRIIFQTTANLTKEGDKTANYSDIRNVVYVDNVRIYETVQAPEVAGYTNEAINTAAVYAAEDTNMIFASGNASDVASAISAATGAKAVVYSNYTAENGGTVNTGAIAQGDVVITEAKGIYKLYSVDVVAQNSVKLVKLADKYTAIANTTDEAKLVLASYTSDDTMVDVDYTQTVAGWNILDSVDTTGAGYISAILVNNFDALTPLCENSVAPLK